MFTIPFLILAEKFLPVVYQKFKEAPNLVASSYFGFIMLASLCDGALWLLEFMIPCSKTDTAIVSLEICDDMNGPQGMCLRGHTLPVEHENACIERKVSLLSWNAANITP